MGHVGSLLYSPLGALGVRKHRLWQCGPRCAALMGSTLKHLAVGCSRRGHAMGLGGIWHVQLGTGEAMLRRVTCLHIATAGWLLQTQTSEVKENKTENKPQEDNIAVRKTPAPWL